MIDQATIDRIMDAARVEEVIGDYITLKKRGVNYTACCPFHNEKTPSFSVSPVRGIFKCFGCGKAGNAVTFVMAHENLTYWEALKVVGKKYGIEVKERELSPEEQQHNNDRESMMITAAYAQNYFSQTLNNHVDGKNIGMAYFAERGFTKSTVEKFQLGYCLDSRAAFSSTALRDGYKKEFLVKTGLSVERDSGELVDRFFGRVMFPIHSVSGRVIGFGGRTLKTDKTVAKYVNSPESEIYHKSNTLYGIYFAKKTMMKLDKCFLVEGYTDVISMHQAGIENVVASSGTSLTQEQIRLIKRFTPNVTVLYDGDAAGIKASLRGIDMLLEEGLNVKTLLLPDGEDPDSFARSHSATEFTDFIGSHEEDFISFKTKILLSDSKNDPIRRAEVITDIVRSISVIPEAIPRSVYIRECSRLMDIGEDVLTGEVAKLRRQNLYGGKAAASKPAGAAQPGAAAATDGDGAAPEEAARTPPIPAFVENVFCREQEREIIYLLLRFGNSAFFDTRVSAYIINEIAGEDLSFQNLEYQQIFEEYKKLLEASDTVDIRHFINHPDQRLCEMAIDLLSQKYTLSKIWRQPETSFADEDRLRVEVPKAINVYKSKIVTQAMVRLLAEMDGKSSTEQDVLLVKLGELSKVRTKLSEMLERPVF
ncbi:MAG: DNA primase [Prevotellaceae bacterium]|jgi:DNA primase|nr:DNA primase [Prevotellaceae bacterium]